MAIPKAKENHAPIKATKRSNGAKKYAPCPFSHEPNEETKQAMRDVDAGIGLTTYDSVDELWKAQLETSQGMPCRTRLAPDLQN